MAQGMELLDNGTKVFTGPGAAFVTCPCNTPIWYRVITERSPI